MASTKHLPVLFKKGRNFFRLPAMILLVALSTCLSVAAVPASAAGLVTGLSVKDTANASDWSIQPALSRGNTQYGDRKFTLTAVPASVAGSAWIRTANDSKTYTGSTLVTFTITEQADVFVASDDRITSKPSWLSSANGWKDTGENLANDEAQPKTFSLFRKSFPGGAKVSLGNNGNTTVSLYTVIVKSTAPPSLGFEPRNLLSPPQAQTDTSILLLWDKPANIADISFASYVVFRNGTKVGETTKLGFNVTGLTPNTPYMFTVKTKETDGTLSGDSSILTVSTKAVGTILDVRSFGAVGNGTALNTLAIQSAIDACPPGGTVLIPSGTFLSGALFLKSNMTFRIAAGGILKGSTHLADYPLIPCRYGGLEAQSYASLLTLGRRDRSGPFNISNVTIAGEGTIDASGLDLGNAQTAASGSQSRGRAICMMNAQNVYVQGLTVSYAPAWTIHPIYSSRLTFSGLKLVSKNSSYAITNGDGIDPDSSTQVNIFDCTFRTGDDSIALKSGRNLEGYTIGKPTEDVRITDCVIDGSNGGIVIGSEMSGSVRRVLVQNCSIKGLYWMGLDIKSSVYRGGTVEDIVYKDITVSNAQQAIRATMKYTGGNDGTSAPVPPTIRNIRYENINCPAGGGGGISIIGLATSRMQNIVFKNVNLTATTGIRVDYANTVTFENVTIHITSGVPYTITNSVNVVVQ